MRFIIACFCEVINFLDKNNFLKDLRSGVLTSDQKASQNVLASPSFQGDLVSIVLRASCLSTKL